MALLGCIAPLLPPASTSLRKASLSAPIGRLGQGRLPSEGLRLSRSVALGAIELGLGRAVLPLLPAVLPRLYRPHARLAPVLLGLLPVPLVWEGRRLATVALGCCYCLGLRVQSLLGDGLWGELWLLSVGLGVGGCIGLRLGWRPLSHGRCRLGGCRGDRGACSSCSSCPDGRCMGSLIVAACSRPHILPHMVDT